MARATEVIGERSSAAPEHAVAFYRADQELVREVAAFVAGGLISGGSAIIVATASHRLAVEAAVAAHSVRVDEARLAGRYVALDAAETLATFTTDGSLDAFRFDAVVGGIVDSAAEAGTPVQIFGEMVALLWDDGDVTGAIELESLWNRLAERREFSLMCAYPATAVDSASLGVATDLCHLHSRVHSLGDHVVPTAHLAPEADVHISPLLVPTPASVRAARHFVAAALESWAEPQIVEDASLIVTELAANAVNHAGSAFRVSATHLGSVVRLTVEDAGPGIPQLNAAGPLAVSGRGLALAAVLAEQWGWQDVPGGKAVWVDLRVRHR
jgi:anti-sigma regulatory factor (Ser/Thr protein kinase)